MTTFNAIDILARLDAIAETWVFEGGTNSPFYEQEFINDQEFEIIRDSDAHNRQSALLGELSYGQHRDLVIAVAKELEENAK